MKSTLCLVIGILIGFPIQLLAQCWNLVYEDNFDGTDLKATNWKARDQPGFWESNGELQYHLVNNVSVSDGALHLIAKKENFGTYQYTSGWVDSKQKVNYRYGKIVARMKLPNGKGLWPAFWLVPEQEAYGEWPKSGEIDIMENIGSDTKTVYGTFHTVDQSDVHVSNSVPFTLPASQDFSADYHDFEFQWTPTTLKWYVDGTLYSTQERTTYSNWKWPFDQQFYIIFSLAVGGSWPGSPDSKTVFPSEFLVDYMRVYQSDDLIEIDGAAKVERTSTTRYVLPDYKLSGYNWEVPEGAKILSGQGTNAILVNWGAAQNVAVDVVCTFQTPCSSTPISVTKSVFITGNVLDNAGFELGYAKWYRNNAIGGATFSLDQVGAGQGTQSAKVQVTKVTPEYWQSQLSRNVYELSGGDRYKVSFLAKSDVSGRAMGVSVLNPVTYATIGKSVFSPTETWQSYQFEVDLSASDTAVLFTFDFGYAVGTFWVDDVSFGKTPDPLPVKLVSFSGRGMTNGNLLLWSTEYEVNNDYFEIERSTDARQFTAIGRVTARTGTGASDGSDYEFLDANSDKLIYYRLKQVDIGGDAAYSRIIKVSRQSVGFELVIAPNPVSDYILLHSDDSNSPKEAEIAAVDGKLAVFPVKANRIDVSSLDPGLYILSVRTAVGKRISRRFVKK